MKNKKAIIILLLLFTGVVGVTFAYFSNTTSLDNLFKSKKYGTSVEEVFESPDSWLPGDTTEKKLVVNNTGDTEIAVRISYTEKWETEDGTTLSGIQSGKRAALINLTNTEEWIKEGNYFYYNKKLDKGQSTSEFLDSVTFNPLIEASSKNNCQEQATENGKKMVCSSTNSGYDNAKYTLTFNIETVQFDNYKNIWNTNLEIGYPTAVQHLLSIKNNDEVNSYESGNKYQVYTFKHPETDNAPQTIDYRFIGDTPNNYIYFNCEDEDDTSTCEVWRIIGVFDVLTEDGIKQKRIKIVEDNNLEPSRKSEIRNLYSTNKDYLGDKTIQYEASFDLENNRNISAPDMYSWEINQIYNSYRYNYYSLNHTGLNYPIFYYRLMNPSDYLYNYALGVDDTCFNNISACNEGNPNKSWIYQSILKGQSDNEIKQWLLPSSNTTGYSLIINSNGNIDHSLDVYHGYGDTFGYLGRRIATYIDPYLYFSSGTGEESNPYVLSFVPPINIKDNYKTYSKGEEVTYDNQGYYVMEDSDNKTEYLKLLKKELLTAEEINEYADIYTSTNGEYPYLRYSECWSSSSTACTTNYNRSDIKTIIDGWASQYDNDLIKKGGYKARIVKESELFNNLGFESYYDSPNTYYNPTENTPDWAIIEGKPYWTMVPVEDSNAYVFGVSNQLTSNMVDSNKIYIRPVINLNKCALPNGCSE